MPENPVLELEKMKSRLQALKEEKAGKEALIEQAKVELDQIRADLESKGIQENQLDDEIEKLTEREQRLKKKISSLLDKCEEVINADA